MSRRRPATPRAPQRPAPASAGGGVWWRAAAIVLAGTLVYASALPYPFVFDDRATVVENTSIRDLSSPRVFTPDREVPTAGRPIVNLSHALNYAIGGLDPLGFRIGNLSMHLACALLVFALVRLTFPIDIAFFAALLWALHPLNTEVVEYITQRSESMMALAYLGTLYASARAAASRSRLWPAAAVAVCGLGMLCKESMVTAPLAVLLYDRTFVFGSWTAAVRRRWTLYLALAATWILLAAATWSGPRAYSAGFGAGVSPWVYLLNQSMMIARYLWRAVWPTALVIAYGPPLPLSLADVWPYALLVVALFAATVYALVRAPRIGFVGAWVFLTLAPTSSIVPIATEVGAERRMYLPLVAIAVGVVACTAAVATRFSRVRERRIVAAAAVAMAAMLAVASMSRLREYETPLGLAQTVLDRWPTSFAHAIVGTQLAVSGRHDEAIAQLRVAAPGYPVALYHLGGELFNQGRTDEALPELEAFVQVLPWRAEAVAARTMIARTLMLRRQWSAAADQLRLVLTMTPTGSAEHTTALGFLADTLFSTQQFGDAIDAYRRYLAVRPRDAGGWINLGIALAETGRTPDAVAAFERAVEVDPSNARARQNLAIAREDLRR